ncbi:MAG TPA: DUF2867 domain-containing protein [Myxococcota bacterium]|nr:DUF2867 domain-containing protein [Myxococcota bacterium]
MLLRDVSAVDLPGGGSGRKVADAKRLLFAGERRPGLVSRALFGFRFWVGRVYGWDRPVSQAAYSDARLPDPLRRRSLVPTGTRDGLFRLLYELPRESLGEVRNATVHGFVCSALVPRAGGYRFYFAVYVAPVSRWTPLYMATIEPFRRFVIYPAMLARLRAAWQSAYPRT